MPATGTPAASSTPQPSGTPSGSPAAFNACSLLTDSEASAVTGMSYNASVASASGGSFQCNFEGGGGSTILNLAVTIEPDAATAKAQYPASIPFGANSYLLGPLPNFADGAIIFRSKNPNAPKVGGIVVLAGKAFFIIFYEFARTIPSDAQLKDAATLVKGRLP